MEDDAQALGEQERPAAMPLSRRNARQLVAPSAQEQQSLSHSPASWWEWQHSVTSTLWSMTPKNSAQHGCPNRKHIAIVCMRFACQKDLQNASCVYWAAI